MESDAEFDRCYFHGKPWEHMRPGKKPFRYKPGPTLTGCMECRALFRNDTEWYRHVVRMRHIGAIGIRAIRNGYRNGNR